LDEAAGVVVPKASDKTTGDGVAAKLLASVTPLLKYSLAAFCPDVSSKSSERGSGETLGDESEEFPELKSGISEREDESFLKQTFSEFVQ